MSILRVVRWAQLAYPLCELPSPYLDQLSPAVCTSKTESDILNWWADSYVTISKESSNTFFGSSPTSSLMLLLSGPTLPNRQSVLGLGQVGLCQPRWAHWTGAWVRLYWAISDINPSRLCPFQLKNWKNWQPKRSQLFGGKGLCITDTRTVQGEVKGKTKCNTQISTLGWGGGGEV
jgi:hypothetical protein